MYELPIPCPLKTEKRWRSDPKLFKLMYTQLKKQLKGTIPRSWPDGAQCPPRGSHWCAESLAADYYKTHARSLLKRLKTNGTNFRLRGLRVLMGDYYSKSQGGKRYEEACDLLGPELAPLLLQEKLNPQAIASAFLGPEPVLPVDERCREERCQPPDLLVHSRRDHLFFFSEAKKRGENLRENLNFRQKCVFPHMEQLLRRYFSNGQRQSRGMPVTFDIVIARLAPTAERRRWTRTLQQAFPKEKAHDQSHDD